MSQYPVFASIEKLATENGSFRNAARDNFCRADSERQRFAYVCGEFG